MSDGLGLIVGVGEASEIITIFFDGTIEPLNVGTAYSSEIRGVFELVDV